MQVSATCIASPGSKAAAATTTAFVNSFLLSFVCQTAGMSRPDMWKPSRGVFALAEGSGPRHGHQMSWRQFQIAARPLVGEAVTSGEEAKHGGGSNLISC